MGTVRHHYYRGLVQLPKHKSSQFGADSVLGLAQPRLTSVGGAVTTNTSTAVTTTAAPAGTQVAVIKNDPGERHYYEVQNEANSTTATSDSPIAEGEVVVQFNQGWTLSLLQVP